MAESSAQFHESPDVLKPQTMDRHRAIASIMEELEAVDWYDQRVDATQDEDLRAILAHNRDEEKEHAAMVLEWLRRRDAKLAEHLRDYLFTEQSIVAREEVTDKSDTTVSTAGGSLGIGSLRQEAGR